MTRIEDLKALLDAPAPDRAEIARGFEGASPSERVKLIQQTDARSQAKLWQIADPAHVSIDEMVPRELGPLVPVIFHGKNSLPAFTHFQKRFCRPSADVQKPELWGYNYQPTGWLGALTGPGYFVAYDSHEAIGGVAVDYRRIPTAHPPDWPELHDNTYRLSRFIFNGMVDYLRRVSRHVLIGRATRGGKEMPNYFVLCREDPA